MRVKLVFSSEKRIILPIGFNEAIQGLIYNLINDSWLHNEGFSFEKRKFKLFVFSEILEKAFFDNNKKMFSFPKQISLIVASPIDWILQNLATNAIYSSDLFLVKNKIRLKEIAVIPAPIIKKQKIIVKTLSPIEVHSSFEKDGKIKTHYYAAKDNEFGKLINDNLRKKWMSLYKKECPYEIKIKPCGNNREKIVHFGMGKRDIIVKGWIGYFELESNIDFLNFALDTGLGSRNSQGFGMIEFVKNQ